ncbi:MAG: HdeD family acid-resistance protein [Methanosarcina sp.]
MEEVTTEYTTVTYEEARIPWWIIVLEGIVAVLIGLFLLFSPVATTILLVQILGVFWLLGGIFSIFSLLVDRENMGWKLLSGLLGIIAGALVFIYPYSPFVILTLLVIILGVSSIVYGVVRLIWAVKGGGFGMAILGILEIIIGILLLANPLVGAVILPWVYGITLIVGGIAALIGGIKMKSSGRVPQTG